LSDDDAFGEACRSIANCGRGVAPGAAWYGHVRLGTNSRITELQAALLSAQLMRLEEQTLLRERNAALLDAALAEVDGLEPQPGDERITRRAYHLYCMRIRPEAFGCTRAQFCKAAEAEGLPVSPGYGRPLYTQPVFSEHKGYEYGRCHCPVTEDLCYTSGMWIFHSVLLGTEADMQDIIAIVHKIKDHVDEMPEVEEE